MSESSPWRHVRDVLLVTLLLAAAAGGVYAAGGTRSALPHAFYVPVVIAATRYGLTGAVLAAATAGFLCGPVMPLDVAAGTMQDAPNWLIRAAFFLAVGVVAAIVTERLRRGLAAERAIAEERADLASARSVLLQVVSHEIRTPLTVLKGGMELLDRLDELGPQGRKMVPAMGRAFDRLEDLAEVVVAAVDPGATEERRPREVALQAVLREAVESVSPSLDPSRVTISAGDGLIETEPQHLRLIVRCLVENALKFSPAGSPVDVSADATSQGVLVEVRDSGPGIPDDFTTGELQMMRQGDPSMTREQGGLGLGLYTARRLVERLGGELVLRRTGENGTSAAVLLPTTMETAAGWAADPAPGSPRARRLRMRAGVRDGAEA